MKGLTKAPPEKHPGQTDWVLFGESGIRITITIKTGGGSLKILTVRLIRRS